MRLGEDVERASLVKSHLPLTSYSVPARRDPRGELTRGFAVAYRRCLGKPRVALALCDLIGFEREARGQAAGLMTHIILGVGATLFTLVSAHGFENFRTTPGQAGVKGGAASDPAGIAARIVSIVGFLGAGAILRCGRDIRGVTTAAT